MNEQGEPGRPQHASVELIWIPLGAGQQVVRLSGKLFEALAAAVGRRRRLDLYHSALVIETPDGSVVIEVAPVVDGRGSDRGVVAEGPVGVGFLGRFREFRYEVRCWRGGSIPDLAEATTRTLIEVESDVARRLVDRVASVPMPVWGRDALDVGEMWNSNSVTSWLLATSGLLTDAAAPPPGGREQGWDAGIRFAAARDATDPAAKATRSGARGGRPALRRRGRPGRSPRMPVGSRRRDRSGS
ncbi:hypothetical protein BH23ACT3_BH23ACT3_17650 [soil metagenome]